jgi:1,4-alpha-glucan branching enzyme
VTTSIKFHTASNWENLDRHALYAPEAQAHPVLYATLDRFQLLWSSPPARIYANPPFYIKRPGVYEENGFLNFVIHAAVAARVRLWGQWMAAGVEGVDLSCTTDRTFWWTRLPVATIAAGSPSGDYDGMEYHYLIDNDRQLQDPAAGWVVHSGFDANSRLMRSDKHVWQSTNWQRPSWEYLMIYQLHPARFTPRHNDLAPLRRITREVSDPAGYLRQVGATAVMLMPLHEFPGDASWGYNPAFYYAIESSYGGPHALKEFVDACHQNGLAVILDLVLNHSGNDTPLWNLARETYFDGDTKWGALVNFDDPICQHYFARCVAYLVEEFRIDGIRLDHTRTILHGDTWEQDIIKVRGSGGGRPFLEALKSAARTHGGPNCIVIGEHLPNEWDVSKNDGPLDCQWADNFHDRLLDNFQSWGSMGELAQAYKITHTEADEWFNAMNYGESHDEVGNEDHRLAKVAGFGRGFRGAKVHASAVLLSRGIPMLFMGAEAAEWRQFAQDDIRPLPLDSYLANSELQRVRHWWQTMCGLHRNPNFQGPAPLEVRFAQDRILGFTRGSNGDYYVLLNFGSWSGALSLSSLNLPDGTYRELWNSTWNEFRSPAEQEPVRSNGGREARLNRGSQLLIADIGVIILERVG